MSQPGLLVISDIKTRGRYSTQSGERQGSETERGEQNRAPPTRTGQRHARPGAYFRSGLGMHRCVFSGVVKALWFSLIKGLLGVIKAHSFTGRLQQGGGSSSPPRRVSESERRVSCADGHVRMVRRVRDEQAACGAAGAGGPEALSRRNDLLNLTQRFRKLLPSIRGQLVWSTDWSTPSRASFASTRA